MMWIDVEFKYGEPVIATLYTDRGLRFMKSEVKVNIPKRPEGCTKDKYSKWQGKVVDKINQAVLKSLPKELYGTININIKGLE